ncbi:MAG: LytTR family DNA-binding domain-containing protein [Bacteroidetes bacterium]|jgi:DNA-binding LytR/AlgR family response regulator|nr:LytTR family DNA-binding domain-containing protein [Bacteroidota bacterium]MDF1865877.1 LytTR family DNA-binding domain-containing protein [Saprospiraceae bacterium]
MKILIIEDEILAAERLTDLIKKYDSTIQILDTLDSIRDSVNWFQNNPAPDLCFMDIQLADGLSFDIFEKISVDCPIIFSTAYDEYALRAFRVNSIDYLLKPIDSESVTQAFEQFDALIKNIPTKKQVPDLDIIQKAMQMLSKAYKTRFIVKAGNHLSSIPTDDILYFYSEHRTTWIKTNKLKKHAIDYTLEQLEDLLDPNHFFRLNRKFFTSFSGIKDVMTYSNSRLKVQLLEASKEELILISREKVREFKEWLDQ